MPRRLYVPVPMLTASLIAFAAVRFHPSLPGSVN